MSDMARQAVKVKETRDPNAERHKVYEELFAIYRDVYPNIMSLNHRLAALEG